MNYKIYSIHGTFAAESSQRGHRWWQKESEFSEKVLSFLDTDTYRISWEPYQWSGENSAVERGNAAVDLAKVLSLTDYGRNRIAMVAHSHGGNVAYGARTMAKLSHSTPESPIITVGTPFLLESRAEPWVDSLISSIRVDFIVLIACLVCLGYTDPGGLLGKSLVVGAFASAILLGIAFFLKIVANSLMGFSIFPHFLVKGIFERINIPFRINNSRDPKIYSEYDEAINALRATPSQKIKLADTYNAIAPVAIAVAVILILLGAMAIYRTGFSVGANVVRNLSVVLVNDSTSIYLQWIAFGFDLVLLVTASVFIGFQLSRLLLARWAAWLFNKSLTRILKERAFGRDGVLGNVFPMIASPNLPLLFETYRDGEEWASVPKSLDEDLDEITSKAAVGTFRSIRDTLGKGLYTGNYTFSETVSSNFRGDELFHSAYFEHPDLPGFVAWILCEFYEFPKGAKYPKLPADKFKEWWEAICPSQFEWREYSD